MAGLSFRSPFSYLQLNSSIHACKTYLVQTQSQALLIDPLRDSLPLYLSLLAYKRLSLKYVVDTHSHADHLSAAFRLRQLTGAKYVMHESAPAPNVDCHVRHNDALTLDGHQVKVLHTPGHTPDSISLYTGDAVFTGDTLFIGGCGRTDFSGGDPGTAYDSISQRLFTLPRDTVVWPSHDYRYNTSSTVGVEMDTNPRLANKTREEFIHIMNNLGLPLPEKIMEALQINTGAPESASGSTSPTSSSFSLPTYSQLNSVRQVDPVGVLDVLKQYTNNLDSSSPSSSLTLVSPVPPIIDVREPQEFTSDTLPGIPGSLNIPLSRLASALASSKSNSTPYTIPPQFRSCPTLVLVCRAGVRSATAASVLSAYGYDNVVNLKGGLLTMKDELVKMKKR